MNKIKTTAGITWAFLGLILMIILFPGLSGFSKSFGTLPFMKINPRYSGGEVAFTQSAGACTLAVHKPVFNGLVRDRNTGFVQVDWRGKIPDQIRDTIDYDNDNVPDFVIAVDTKKPASDCCPLSGRVTGLGISSRTSFGWAARINLRKTP
jgi:hypothetical protein